MVGSDVVGAGLGDGVGSVAVGAGLGDGVGSVVVGAGLGDGVGSVVVGAELGDEVGSGVGSVVVGAGVGSKVRQAYVSHDAKSTTPAPYAVQSIDATIRLLTATPVAVNSAWVSQCPSTWFTVTYLHCVSVSHVSKQSSSV